MYIIVVTFWSLRKRPEGHDDYSVRGMYSCSVNWVVAGMVGFRELRSTNVTLETQRETSAPYSVVVRFADDVIYPCSVLRRHNSIWRSGRVSGIFVGSVNGKLGGEDDLPYGVEESHIITEYEYSVLWSRSSSC